MVTHRSEELPEASRTATARGSVEAVLESLIAPIAPGADPEETADALERAR